MKTNVQATNRLHFIDHLRVLSVGLVMYGHFVLVGGGAKTIPNVIREDAHDLPILDHTNWGAQKFEILLIESFSSQSAILGVAMFFVITGYLMPIMMERYSRKQFMINRFFRIYPLAIVTALLIAPFAYFAQGFQFTAWQIFATASLLYPFLGVPVFNSVLWTLVVEMLFYITVFLIGRFTILKLLGVQVAISFLIYCSIEYPEVWVTQFLGWNARFVLMICIGCAIYLAEKQRRPLVGFLLILWSLLLSYVGFKEYADHFDDTSTYQSFGTHTLVVLGFLSYKGYFSMFVSSKSPLISTLSELVYPLYLVHMSFGLTTMYLLKDYLDSNYMLFITAVAVSVLASAALHIVIERPGIQWGRYFMIRPLPAGAVS